MQIGKSPEADEHVPNSYWEYQGKLFEIGDAALCLEE